MFDLLSAFVNLGVAIDNLWNIFLGVHFLLFGGLIQFRSSIGKPEVIILLPAYYAFSVINGRAISDAYVLYAGMRDDIATFLSTSPTKLLSISNTLSTTDLSGRQFITSGLHVAAAVLVTFYCFYTQSSFSGTSYRLTKKGMSKE